MIGTVQRQFSNSASGYILASMDAADAAAGAVVPAAAAAVAAPANPITMAAVAVRQRLDVQAIHAKALEKIPHSYR